MPVGGGLEEELREEAGERREMCSFVEGVEEDGGMPCVVVVVGLRPFTARKDCKSYGRNPGCPKGNWGKKLPAGGSNGGAVAGGVDGRPFGEFAEVDVVPEFNEKNSEFGKIFPAGGVKAGDPITKQKKHGKLIIC